MQSIKCAAGLLGRRELGGARRFKWAFLCALGFELATHLFCLTNVLLTGDGLNFLYTDISIIGHGRWLGREAMGLNTHYSLPWAAGLIALVLLAVCAALIIGLLDIRSRAGVAASGAIIAAFPATACTLAFMHTADAYFAAMLLAVLAVAVSERYRWGFAVGGVLLGVSLAVYQTYLSIAMLLFVLLAVLKLLRGSETRDILKSLGRALLCGAIALIFYYVGLRVALNVSGEVLNEYKGISEMGSLTAATLLSGIKEAYYDFLIFLKDGLAINGDGLLKALVYTFVALGAGCFVFVYIRRGLYKNAGKTTLLAVCALLVPLCCGCFYIVSAQMVYNMLMRYGWAVLFIFCVALAELAADEARGSDKAYVKKLAGAALALSVAVCMLVSYKYYLISNVGYYNMQQRYEKTYGTALRILDRAEQTEGYYPWIHTVMFGTLPSTSEPATGYATADVAALTGMNGDNICINGYYTRKFIDNYLNVTLNVPPSAEVIAEITASEEYAAMEPWPAATSTRVIDDVLVIKLSESSEIYS